MNISSVGIRERWRESVRNLTATLASPAAPLGDEEPETDVAAAPVPAQIQLRAWAEVLRVPWVDDLRDRHVSVSFVERFPIRFARQHCVVALSTDAGDAEQVEVAISSLGSWPVLDMVRRHLRRKISPLFAPEDRILTAINAAYQQRDGQATTAMSLLDTSGAADTTTLTIQEDLLDAVNKPPVIRLVNSVLFEAIQARASDVHIQPQEDDVVARQRIDGVLFDALHIPKGHQEEVISRLKILGGMNIAEKRLPQDGRATVEFGDRLVDLRIATLPTSFGERVVIRFLDKNAQLYTLDELGMSEQNGGDLKRLIKRDHGILLVTGPTGSGKSTTLYAALQEINSKVLNVITLEDPIEYQLAGISQTQINQKKGLTFAKGLRHVLRQDPDIIMVGEIRDRETAEMAIQSALTGHLVFSTLHTNDAASAVTRLLDLGIEPYLTASSVIAVLAQRLVRQLCRHCKRLGSGTSHDDASLHGCYEAVGCAACRRTGFQGRVGIFELLVISDAIRDLVQNRANAQNIRAQAIKERMTLLYDDGLRKVREGVTTIDEVLRVTTFE
ncbi:MAG: GspE/PulE family protein [Pirellulaceae bacterium]